MRGGRSDRFCGQVTVSDGSVTGSLQVTREKTPYITL